MQNISLPDQRMIQLMEYAMKNSLVQTESEYWERIEFARTNLTNVRRGIQSFRIDHVINACKFTGASADWVLGLSASMFAQTKKKTGMQLLKEATAQLEMELKKQRGLKVFL